MEPFERNVIRNIRNRQWSDIRGQWLGFIPTIDPAGSKPPEPLLSFVGLEDAVRGLRGASSTLLIDAPGVREVMFREAIFLFHKASHVIGCAEVSAANGALTWSLVQAYQGAFYGVKAILHLLGVAVPEHRQGTILVDVWPKQDVLRSGDTRAYYSVRDTNLQFTKIGKRIGHFEVWQLFMHAINIAAVNVWPVEYVSAIRGLSPNDFAAQRNLIQYGTHTWVYDDLHEFTLDDKFGEMKSKVVVGFSYLERSDFSLIIALAILRLGYLLIEDLTTLSNKLADEKALIDRRMIDVYHPLFLSTAP